MHRTLSAVLLLVTCIGAGCRGPAPLRVEQELERAPASAERAVHGPRLSQLMHELDQLRQEDLRREDDLHGDQRHRVGQIARSMADAAERIPEAASDVGLAGEEREAFTALALSLARRTRRLADDAEDIDAIAVQVRLDSIEANCEACHERFRIPRVVP